MHRGRRPLLALFVAGLGLAQLGGCAAIAPVDERDLPTLRLKSERERPDPTHKACKPAHEVTLLRGPVPAGATLVATVRLTAVDRPAPLKTYESVLRQWSAKHCIEGISVLRAEEAEADRRTVLKVTAGAWTVLPANERPAEAPVVQPDPEAAEREFWD